MPAYIRPLGEPNRCLNPYTAIRCDGSERGGRHTTHWYKQAFRRMYLILHGGKTRRTLNRKLHKLHLPGLRRKHGREPDFLPRAPISVIWSPLPSGSPSVRHNSAEAYFPGNRYIDWVGADIYSRYTDFGGITRLCHRYGRRKPFAITEFGLWGADDPGFIRHLLHWVRAHRKTRMLVYYQDFGTQNPFRIQNFPAGQAVLKHALNSHRFPPRGPGLPPALAAHGHGERGRGPRRIRPALLGRRQRPQTNPRHAADVAEAVAGAEPPLAARPGEKHRCPAPPCTLQVLDHDELAPRGQSRRARVDDPAQPQQTRRFEGPGARR